ncbi:MAG: hypothetical protein ABI360_00115, partial [Allobranchiibius sp.]
MTVIDLLSQGPRLLLPGIVAPEPGLETYWVRPGGVTGLLLAAGDELTVVDRFGRQLAELTVINQDGSATGAALGVSHDSPATILRDLGARSGSVGPVLADLIAKELLPDQLRAVRLFGDWSPAGTRQSFVAA